ncbi:MAG: hypothetical protein AB7I41_03815 [Candidatus Sericytochromatia bacterium]
MNTHFLGRPAPIYMLGDSQCLVFNHLLFEAEHLGRCYSLLTQARYCPGLAAHTFANAPEQPQLRLHETILRALLSDCLIDRENKALYQFESPQAGLLSLLAGRVAASPVLVFFCGSADLVNIFLRHLGNENDFYLPEQDSLLAGFADPGPRRLFPYETARDYLKDLIAPLFRGLNHLKQLGFDQLYLHDLVPQTPDDDEYARIYGYRCPLKVRSKALLLMNQLLREMADSNQVGWISIWEKVTQNNIRRPEFGLDSIHLNKQAAFLSVDTLWQIMCQDLPAIYVSDSDQTQTRLESLNELTLQLAHGALQGRFAEVWALWQTQSEFWDWIAAHQNRLLPQLEPLVSALHALAQSLWALGLQAQLPNLLGRFAPTLYRHRPFLQTDGKLENTNTAFCSTLAWNWSAAYDPVQIDALFIAALRVHEQGTEQSPEQGAD